MSPKQLTDTQLVLLSAASQREDGAIEQPKRAVAKTAITKLLSDGLVQEVPAHGTLPVWRRDNDHGTFALLAWPLSGSRSPVRHRKRRSLRAQPRGMVIP